MWSGGEARMARPWRCDLWPDSRIMSLPGARGPPDCDEFWLLSPFVCCQDPLTWPWSFSFWRFIFFFLLTFSFFLFFPLFCRTEMGESGLLNFHQNRPAGCYIFFWWGVMCSWLFWGEEELVHSGSRWIKKKSVWVAFEGGLKTEHSINPPYSTVASVDVARQRVDCKGVLQFVE